MSAREAAADIRAILAELSPNREWKMLPPETIACVVLLRREIQHLRDDTKTFQKLAPAYAQGVEPRITVKPRSRKGPKE